MLVSIKGQNCGNIFWEVVKRVESFNQEKLARERYFPTMLPCLIVFLSLTARSLSGWPHVELGKRARKLHLVSSQHHGCHGTRISRILFKLRNNYSREKVKSSPESQKYRRGLLLRNTVKYQVLLMPSMRWALVKNEPSGIISWASEKTEISKLFVDLIVRLFGW